MIRNSYLILSFCFSLIAQKALSQAGSLDNTFGSSGEVIHNIGNYFVSRGITVQPDNKILIIGDRETHLVVIRMNPDGSYDNSFGSGGVVNTSLSSNSVQGWDIALQADGKILAAGFTGDASTATFALVRYNSDGSLDNGFGTSGIAYTNFGSPPAYGRSIALQSDGKIVMTGGVGAGSDFGLARFTSTGSLDAAFGNSGLVKTSMGIAESASYDVKIQSDGKILVCGIAEQNSSADDYAFARYTTTGSLDNTFGSGGRAYVDWVGGNDGARGIDLQSDGKIVATGYVDAVLENDMGVCRLNSNGSLDNSFDSDGKKFVSFEFDDDAGYDILIQPDGKILTAGPTGGGFNNNFGVARLESNGSQDFSFDFDGYAETGISGDDIAMALALDNQYQILVTGYSGGTGSAEGATLRHLSGLVNDLAIIKTIEDFKFYPNPAKDFISIQRKVGEFRSIEILNLQGKTIQRIDLDNQLVDISFLDQGVYLLRLLDDSRYRSQILIKE